jgi:hypothetical protein
MSHTITPTIKKELRAFADRITPPQAKPGSVPGRGLTGAELKTQYGLTRDAQGQPLKDAERYLTKDVPAVNQLRRLSKAFQAGGWPQVELYLQPFRTPEAVAREAAAAEVATGAPLELEPSPAVFEPLPEVAAAAQQLSAGGRGAGSQYARQQLQESLAAGLHYPADEGVLPAGPLYVAGYSDEVGTPAAAAGVAWLDESGTVTPEQLPATARGFCPIEAGAPSCSCSSCSCSASSAA